MIRVVDAAPNSIPINTRSTIVKISQFSGQCLYLVVLNGEDDTALIEHKIHGVLFADHEICFERWDHFGPTEEVIFSKFH